MYRRHMRMVLVRDVESNNVRSEFLHRMASIPVVYLAWNIAAETYKNVKTSNKLLNASLTTTEKAAFFVSAPILKKLEKQLKLADIVACKGLTTLQAIIPSFSHQKDKLYRRTITFYNDTVESGLKKYAVVKHIGTTKVLQFVNEGSQKFDDFMVSPYGETCEIALDIAFRAGELYVDHYLPPLGDERPEKFFGDRGKEPTWKRAELLRNRLKERLYKHTLLKIQRVKLQTKSFVAKIYKFNMYEYLIEISSKVPSVVYSTCSVIVSSMEDIVNYLVSLIIEQTDELPLSQEIYTYEDNA